MLHAAPFLRLTALSALIALSLAPEAQAQTSYGARKAPSVSVDMTVLDELGALPNVPQALAPTIPRPSMAPAAPAPTGIVHLRPPAEKKKSSGKTKHTSAPAAPKSGKTAMAPVVPATTTPEPIVPPAPPAPTGSPATSAPATSAPAANTPVTSVPATSAPVAPPAPSAASPAPASPAPQVAARPAAVPADTVRITFDGTATELSEAAKQALKGVADKMQADQEVRLQLVAYAMGPGDKGNEARRTSLSRALSARQYLIGQGVRSTRIDVRALGHTDEGPADRLDAVLSKR
jgi:outer membrane protein OmpA-like peptidoglycan-associated protein